jgi:hypothetical protein
MNLSPTVWVHWKLTIDISHTEFDYLETPELVGIDRWVSIPGVASNCSLAPTSDVDLG